MSTEYQKPKTRDRALSLLNAAIDTLNLARGIPSSTPAKAVFGSVSVLLTMIKVYSFSSYGGEFPVHIHPGSQGQQKGLRRSWADLCRYLSSPRSRNERREEAGRPQSVCVRDNKSVDDVGLTCGSQFGRHSLVCLITERLRRSRRRLLNRAGATNFLNSSMQRAISAGPPLGD